MLSFFILQSLVLIRFENVTRFAFVEFFQNMIYWSTKLMQIYRGISCLSASRKSLEIVSREFISRKASENNYSSGRESKHFCFPPQISLICSWHEN